jgi:hypothetical protein
LACLDASEEPAVVKVSGAPAWSEQPFQLRRVYQLQMVPRDSEYQDFRTIVDIDSETFLMLSYELFKGSERVSAMIPLRRRTSPEGGSLFELAGSVLVPSDHPGLFVSFMTTPGSQRFNTNEPSDAIFNPKTLH